jgi:hypothetical protein
MVGVRKSGAYPGVFTSRLAEVKNTLLCKMPYYSVLYRLSPFSVWLVGHKSVFFASARVFAVWLSAFFAIAD